MTQTTELSSMYIIDGHPYPHPGTLNLDLRDNAARERWKSWRNMPGDTIKLIM